MILIEEIKRIKYLRMKPEERFLFDILSKVEFKYCDKYPDSIFLTLNGKILFEQDLKNELFHVHYDDIWIVLINKYNIKYRDIQILITDMVWKTINLKVNTSNNVIKRFNIFVWEYLNNKGLNNIK